MGESAKEDDKITCLVGRDRWTSVTFAHVVKGKGFRDDWIIGQTYEDLQSLGYPEVAHAPPSASLRRRTVPMSNGMAAVRLS